MVFAARDEEGNILPLHAGIRKALGSGCEIIGVDDGSRDGTLSEMRMIRDPNFQTIVLGKRTGKCRALYEGISAASGDVIVTIDADLQDDPEDIERMLSEIEGGWDCVCGWRHERADGPLKRACSRIGNVFNNAALGLSMHDNNCPLKAFRRECLSGVGYFRNFHRFIPAIMSSGGFRIKEVKVSHRPRVRGRSKYGVHDRIFGNILTIMMLKAGRGKVLSK